MPLLNWHAKEMSIDSKKGPSFIELLVFTAFQTYCIAFVRFQWSILL